MSLNLAAGGTINNAATCVNRACVCVCVFGGRLTPFCVRLSLLYRTLAYVCSGGERQCWNGALAEEVVTAGRVQDAAAEISGVGEVEGGSEGHGRESEKERRRADKNRGGAREKHRGTLKNTVIRAEGKRDKERLAGASEGGRKSGE